MITDDTIICRCEDITYKEIVDAIDMGVTTVAEIEPSYRPPLKTVPLKILAGVGDDQD
ncbi:hypothetical protein B6D60_11280 [candidate division KSB1 bacterium 4484_87]|nr:MAG: hypothetical protein B6D60_11280 [candidate division KSB1 bacterium 4484_87]